MVLLLGPTRPLVEGLLLKTDEQEPGNRAALDAGMQTRCYFCRCELQPLYVIITEGGKPQREFNYAVWADTSVGRIGVCNVCYEEKRFDRLTSSDIATLHYSFGSPYQEDADYKVAIKRLKLAFELSPCPQIEGALGYAQWKLGRNRRALRHC